MILAFTAGGPKTKVSRNKMATAIKEIEVDTKKLARSMTVPSLFEIRP
jgi:hypothetical protein